MKIFLATDHAGFEMKEYIKNNLSTTKHEIVDLGALTFDPVDDYPEYISKAAREVSKDENSIAIIFGGSGYGEAMVANRIKGVRCMVYNTNNKELIKVSREHNNSNILSIGARYLSNDNAIEAVKTFILTPFSYNERHIRRINKIDEI